MAVLSGTVGDCLGVDATREGDRLRRNQEDSLSSLLQKWTNEKRSSLNPRGASTYRVVPLHTASIYTLLGKIRPRGK